MSDKPFDTLFGEGKLDPDIERYIPKEMKPSLLASVQTNKLIAILHQTISDQIVATNRQSKALNWLTWVAIALGVIQAIASVIQVWLAFRIP
ncbi:MAG: hypothetical protein WBL62_00110 [Gallionella sp.]